MVRFPPRSHSTVSGQRRRVRTFPGAVSRADQDRAERVRELDRQGPAPFVVKRFAYSENEGGLAQRWHGSYWYDVVRDWYVPAMSRRELLFFEWVVVDNCNQLCPYCVNKGELSHKTKAQMSYVPGRELDVARKLGSLACEVDRVIVNLTGGEPLMSDHIVEVLDILAAAPNVSVQLITNMKRIPAVGDALVRFPSLSIAGSLHVGQRSEREWADIVTFLKAYRRRLRISLSQVDHGLTQDDRAKLALVQRETGLRIAFQTYIPPWSDAVRVADGAAVSNAHCVSSLGKRCCLGYSHFFVQSDGVIRHGLWCNEKTTKHSNLLSLARVEDVMSPHMARCPQTSCGCNYNMFQHAEYLAACRRLGYRADEMFTAQKKPFIERLKRRIRTLRAAVPRLPLGFG